jgi:acetolactate synthase I/II/III large subunit
MSRLKKTAVDRRGFLKGAAAGAAALVAKPPLAEAQQQVAAEAPRNGGARPNATTLAADSGRAPVGPPERIVENPGSDYMVDVIKSLGIEYCASNPGSTFDGLHESLINHGMNTMPEFLTCCHEESSVAMAHGYAEIEGKPMMALIHGTVGLQHASMAIYNAYADRVPIYMVVGNHADSAARGAGVQSYHSANDMGALVRDFTKWDDQPVSLGAFGDAAVRAYKVAMTPPMGPVLVVASHETQTETNREPRLRVPKLVLTSPPAADEEAVAEMAKTLVAARSPLIISERTVRSPEGRKLLTQLAEVLQAPVNSNERMEIGNRHPLAGNGGPGYQPDVTLCLEVADMAATARANRARGAKTISISSVDLFHKSNIQDFGHYASDLDLDVGADAEATLPALIEACQKLITADRKRRFRIGDRKSRPLIGTNGGRRLIREVPGGTRALSV